MQTLVDEPHTREHDDDDDDGGLDSLVKPVLEGVASPIFEGAGRGVAGAAAGTSQIFDFIGEILQTLGGVAANAEQGAGVALTNAAPAVQGTVYVQS